MSLNSKQTLYTPTPMHLAHKSYYIYMKRGFGQKSIITPTHRVAYIDDNILDYYTQLSNPISNDCVCYIEIDMIERSLGLCFYE